MNSTIILFVGIWLPCCVIVVCNMKILKDSTSTNTMGISEEMFLPQQGRSILKQRNNLPHTQWGPWRATSACTVTCGGGYMTLHRDCNWVMSGFSAPFTPTCRRRREDIKAPCNVEACPVDGVWSEWAEWMPYSGCGGSVVARFRQCYMYIPPGAPCVGPSGDLKVVYNYCLRPLLLSCKSCNRVSSLDECSESVRCAVDEICFMDKIFTKQGSTLFSGGCRSRNLCTTGINASSLVGRREMFNRNVDDQITCSQCCDHQRAVGNDTDCNAKLCGISYINTNATRCYWCDSSADDTEQGDVQNPDDCLRETTCAPDEVCGAKRIRTGTTDTFRYMCMLTTICTSITREALMRMEACLLNNNSSDPTCLNYPQYGKRQASEICTVCCGDRLCNIGSCEEILGYLFGLWKDNALDFETLKEVKRT